MASGTQSPSDSLPTTEQWAELSREVKSELAEEMGDESWYLLIVSQFLAVASADCRHRFSMVSAIWREATTKAVGNEI